MNLHLFNPARRHNTPARPSLNLTPPIALVRRKQYEPLTLLHACLAIILWCVRIHGLDVLDFLWAAARCDGRAFLLDAGRGGRDGAR